MISYIINWGVICSFSLIRFLTFLIKLFFIFHLFHSLKSYPDTSFKKIFYFFKKITVYYIPLKKRFKISRIVEEILSNTYIF